MDWFLNQHNYENALFINRDNVFDALASDAHSLTTLCLNCESLKDALDYYSRYRAIVGNVDNLQIERQMNRSSLHLHLNFLNLSIMLLR